RRQSGGDVLAHLLLCLDFLPVRGGLARLCEEGGDLIERLCFIDRLLKRSDLGSDGVRKKRTFFVLGVNKGGPCLAECRAFFRPPGHESGEALERVNGTCGFKRRLGHFTCRRSKFRERELRQTFHLPFHSLAA